VFNQIFEVTLLNLRNLSSRLPSSSVIVVGIAGVVAVLVGLLSMAAGFTAVLDRTSLDTRAIVLRLGANDELSSGVSNEEVNILSAMDGVSLVSGELYVIADIPKKVDGKSANLIVRGMTQSGLKVRPEVSIVGGRIFQPGKGELLAGVKAVDQFAGLNIGDEVDFRDGAWTVVGHFSSEGSANESEVWADLPVVQASFRGAGAVSSVRVLLEEPAKAASISALIEADPRLNVALRTEDVFYAEQSESQSTLINTFGYLVAVIMAIGAVFAALNTMYTAVSARTVEIATLRALGFTGLSVVVSVLIEALLLALLGGLLGGAIVYLVFDGYTASTLNNASFSQIAFDFAVTPQLLQQGLSWALALGLVGGLFPAVRAARMPITTALRGD
jgi:putative ABC transport system permease protein